MIFVDISNKELLEQHLEEYATWMPYGFGEKGMLGLYPTNEHSEEEIIEQLKKYKIPYYTEVTEAVVLSESGNDEADEAYKGIFIDRKTGDFKILTGRFPDKKAMINKYGTLGKDYIARKVFEKPVFDWILNNAKSSLDSYLMFSTAFSKWRHNSILDKYYIKLINDMPQLFKNVRAQDKIGGANSSPKKSADESVEMDEAIYISKPENMTTKKIYLRAYDADKNLVDDFDNTTWDWTFDGSMDDKNKENAELYEILLDGLEDTDENVAYIAYCFQKNTPANEQIVKTKKEILQGYIPDYGYNHSEDIKSRVNGDLSKDEVQISISCYCVDEEGRKIVFSQNKPNMIVTVDRNEGINDYNVWASAMQALNITYPDVGNSQAANCDKGGAASQLVFMVPTYTKQSRAGDYEYLLNKWEEKYGRPFTAADMSTQEYKDFTKEVEKETPGMNFINGCEYYSRRWKVWKNLRNLEAESEGKQPQYLQKGGGDIYQWEISKNQSPRKIKYFDAPNYNKDHEDPGIRLGRVDDIYSRKHRESTEEQKEHEMALREEVKKLIEASGVFDLPDYELDLADDNANNIVRFIVKNTFGKDDIEEVPVNKPISSDVELEDFMLPEVEAAAERIKARNPGKKLFVQVNDEEPTEYIDIEEPQA